LAAKAGMAVAHAMAAATPRRVLRVMIITWSPELLCTDTMTELGYLSNHFFDGINTHFDININGAP
jgi:hypothetical protein